MVDPLPSSGMVVLGSEVIQTMATLMLALIMYRLIDPNNPTMDSVNRHDVHQGTKRDTKFYRCSLFQFINMFSLTLLPQKVYYKFI